jgi:hypothetical protein
MIYIIEKEKGPFWQQTIQFSSTHRYEDLQIIKYAEHYTRKPANRPEQACTHVCITCPKIPGVYPHRKEMFPSLHWLYNHGEQVELLLA